MFMNDTTRLVPIRQFQRNFYKEIKDLPLVITKNKLPFLRVTTYSPDTTISGVTIKEKELPVTTPKPSKKFCKHGYMKGLCKYGC